MKMMVSPFVIIDKPDGWVPGDQSRHGLQNIAHRLHIRMAESEDSCYLGTVSRL